MSFKKLLKKITISYIFSDMHLILVQPKVEYIAKIAIIFNKKCEEYIENKINNKRNALKDKVFKNN